MPKKRLKKYMMTFKVVSLLGSTDCRKSVPQSCQAVASYTSLAIEVCVDYRRDHLLRAHSEDQEQAPATELDL